MTNALVLALALAVAAQEPAAPSTTSEATPQAAGADAAADGGKSKATEKLEELRALLRDGNCDALMELSPYVEEHRLATQAERHEAMFARAYCLVTLGNIAEAGAIFQTVLEEDIDANPPFAVDPRTQVLVDGARGTIVKGRQDRITAARKKLVENIRIEATASPAVKGGSRAFVEVELADPDGVVRSMRVDFRMRGAAEFYALPIARRADGTWRGEIPGTFTRTTTGAVLEWFVTALDASGEPLAGIASREAPRLFDVLPGSDTAEDLRAAERLPKLNRIALSVGPLFITGGSFAAAYSVLGVDPFADFKPLPDLRLPLFGVGVLMFPTALNLAVGTLLLDGWLGAVPAAIALGGSLIIAATAVVDAIDASECPGAPGEGATRQQQYVCVADFNGDPGTLPGIAPLPIIGLVTAVVTTVTVTVTTVVLVALDASAAVE